MCSGKVISSRCTNDTRSVTVFIQGHLEHFVSNIATTRIYVQHNKRATENDNLVIIINEMHVKCV